MTDLAAIREWLEQASEPCGNDACIGEWAAVHGRALLDEVERLREAQRWIPVSERMPKVGSDIWAYSDADGCCWTAYVADDEDYPIVDDLRHLPIQRVTYWMPQTKPPESQP